MSRSRQPNTLAAFRKKRGLSQAQVARLLDDRNRQKLSQYERSACLPSLRKAVLLASLYGTSVEHLFPQLAAHMRTKAAREQESLARTRTRKTYVPQPHRITILALYPGTRKVGVAVFETPHTGQGRHAHSSDQESPARRGHVWGGLGAIPA